MAGDMVASSRSVSCPALVIFSHCGLTYEDRHGLTVGANTGTGHRCHLHLVEYTWHQTFQRNGQRVSIHGPVDVVTRLVVSATSHTPNLFGYTD